MKFTLGPLMMISILLQIIREVQKLQSGPHKNAGLLTMVELVRGNGIFVPRERVYKAMQITDPEGL